MEKGDPEPQDGRENGGPGDRQDPGPDDPVGQAPADGLEMGRRPDADNGACDGVCR